MRPAPPAQPQPGVQRQHATPAAGVETVFALYIAPLSRVCYSTECLPLYCTILTAHAVVELKRLRLHQRPPRWLWTFR